MAARKTRQTAEFGDFQTPLELARIVCRILSKTRRFAPASIVEPTCGKGNFLVAALEVFPDAQRIIGLEINAKYLEEAARAVVPLDKSNKVKLLESDFFSTDWNALFSALPEPILVIGNPPWVTSAELGVLGSTNLPEKSNFQNHTGLDAMTGKSNFDISEWMLVKLLDLLDGRRATIAMLCKTAVARKSLLHGWKNRLHISSSSLHLIDARRHFGAAVDACLLTANMSASSRKYVCSVREGVESVRKVSAFGFRDGRLVADVDAYDRWKHLEGECVFRWRSGVKHDCSKVMELRKEGDAYRNGFGELVELEDEYLFPVLKSSDLANGRTKQPTRFMLITQRSIGQDTTEIETRAPKTWRYLVDHAEALDRRGSSVYKRRPRFSVFGVGDYTFAPWKVAISGLYERLEFRAVGSWQGKPIVLDDTSYFVACESKSEATLVCSLLNSDAARAFYSAFIFWDAKRPITVGALKLLNLFALAKELGRNDELERQARKSRKTKAQLQVPLDQRGSLT